MRFDPNKPTMSVQEAADALGISRNSAYAAVRSGEIASLRIGGRILVPTAPLMVMLGYRPSTGAAA